MAGISTEIKQREPAIAETEQRIAEDVYKRQPQYKAPLPDYAPIHGLSSLLS